MHFILVSNVYQLGRRVTKNFVTRNPTTIRTFTRHMGLIRDELTKFDLVAKKSSTQCHHLYKRLDSVVPAKFYEHGSSQWFRRRL